MTSTQAPVIFMLGVAGLVLMMPGIAAAQAATLKKDDQCKNNNKNNG